MRFPVDFHLGQAIKTGKGGAVLVENSVPFKVKHSNTDLILADSSSTYKEAAKKPTKTNVTVLSDKVL